MSYSSVEVYAKEYFHNLNPIANRISSDVAATRDAYEDLWITLSYKDQRQVLDETIIHPEAVLKYSFSPKNQPEVEYFPRLRIQTGEKYVFDDDGGKGKGYRWRDEHSAPFSFMTRSQLNLNLNGNGNGNNRPATSPKPKPSTPKKPIQLDSFIDPPSIVLGGSALSGGKKLKLPEDGGLLSRLKNNTAVLKIQALKSNLTSDSARKSSEPSELESLVAPSRGKISKQCRVHKPKTPPPAPPKPKTPPPAPPKPKAHVADEKRALLQESPGDEIDAIEATVLIQPTVQQPKVQLTTVQQPKVQQPTVQQRKVQQPTVQQPKVQQPTVQQPTVQQPKPKSREAVETKASPRRQPKEEAKVPSSLSMESLQEFHSALNSPAGSGEDLPKTGFDFLDNW